MGIATWLRRRILSRLAVQLSMQMLQMLLLQEKLLLWGERLRWQLRYQHERKIASIHNVARAVLSRPKDVSPNFCMPEHI